MRAQVEVGQGGLTPVVIAMLAHASALPALQLLQVLRALYEHAPRPKQFVVQFGLADALAALAAGGDGAKSGAPRGSGGGGAPPSVGQSVLVRRQAAALLQALRVHTAL